MNPESIPHLHASARNLAIAQRMFHRPDPEISPPPGDWIITMLFYSELHLVDAYTLTALDEKAKTHHYRNRLVRSDRLLSRISDEYLLLGDLSRTARYTPLSVFTATQVQQAFDQLDVIRQAILPALNPA